MLPRSIAAGFGAGVGVGVGFVMDLEKSRGVKVLDLFTDTPGFRIEVYAAAGGERPADILDTRWAHITNRSMVDETPLYGNKAHDGEERIIIGGGSKKYRYVLLWFTKPPDKGPTVRISNIKLFG